VVERTRQFRFCTARSGAVLGLAAAAGCITIPMPFIIAPQGLTVVPGGITDTRPYFGKLASADAPDQEQGDFLLASCGCGDWRVLMRPADGSPQTQFPVQFYAAGEYVETGDVTVYGTVDGGDALFGTVNQDAGLFDGRAQTGARRELISASRSAAHDLEVTACQLCHIGDDPIWPLPESHPKNYLTNPNVCFDCHTVNGQ
jgi:hypothetical protein